MHSPGSRRHHHPCRAGAQPQDRRASCPGHRFAAILNLPAWMLDSLTLMMHPVVAGKASTSSKPPPCHPAARPQDSRHTRAWEIRFCGTRVTPMTAAADTSIGPRTSKPTITALASTGFKLREGGRGGAGAGRRYRGGVRAASHDLLEQVQWDVVQSRPTICADEVRFDQAVEKRAHEGKPLTTRVRGFMKQGSAVS